MTASLAGGGHSVLCAPVLEPLTGTVLAVLYFQNHGLKRAFTPAHWSWLASYATALSHGFGMHLETERRIGELQENARSLRTQLEEGVPEIVGESEATRKLRGFLHVTLIPEVMDRPQGKPILLLGPSGTGKDQIARYLHFYSETRNRAPFLPFNCAGMGAGELTKSVLFGHVRGAYTGATEARPGLFREANKGVLFLDEIGDLSIDRQAELLRVIQECRVTPLGSSRSTPVDVQLVIATNRDLEAEVKARRFREDLYYRIAVHVIRLAPLASPSRLGDVRPLLTHFIAVQEAQSKKKIAGLTPEALGALLAYSWPGNIRQLINACSVLVAYARRGAWITLDDVTTHCPYVVDPGARRPDAALVSADSEATFKDAALAWEREFLKERLLAYGGNQTKAAHSLGFDYSTLLRKMARCGLPGAWSRGDDDGNDSA
jgi:transcriptional regulator with GAF, ATPase, and Fis domain